MMSLSQREKIVQQQAIECNVLHNLDISKSQRAKKRALNLITSPKGIASLFAVGMLKGIGKPDVASQIKTMAVIFTKNALDGWLTSADDMGEEFYEATELEE